MGNMIINVEEFQCEAPIVGSTYRQANQYIFNWTSKGDDYFTLGLNVTMKLFYGVDGDPTNTEYTSSVIPFNAINFVGPNVPNDMTSFRLQFSVDDGATCLYNIDIPYSSIIT